MMMLSAVVLLVGFLALAGMVARVNQLGTQTGIESRQAILDEAGPLKRSIDNSLARLANRTIEDCCFWSAGTTLQSATPLFSSADIGLNVGGPNIPPGARVTAVASPTSATLSQAMAQAQPPATPATIRLWKPGFALNAATTPTAQSAVVALLDQMQAIEAQHGFWMDWELTCADPSDPATGQVVASLSDATIWLEVRSTVTFPRADCAPVSG